MFYVEIMKSWKYTDEFDLQDRKSMVLFMFYSLSK